MEYFFLNTYVSCCEKYMPKKPSEENRTLSMRITYLQFGSIYHTWDFLKMLLSKSHLLSETENENV